MSFVTPHELTSYSISPQLSRFTFDDLEKLKSKTTSYQLKLAVIGHIDLNAFFAQVEQIRLNLTIDDPVVCVQWQAVIAVSYAARKFGINRMDTVVTCKQKCPNVILAHAAVYEKGSTSWKYLDKLPFQGNCKVSLDPYRRESRKIFKILAANCDLIEKASVDEGFLDLGRLLYQKLIHLFPDLQNGTGDLPPIPDNLTDCEFKGYIFTPNKDDPLTLKDWDDVLFLLGSNLIYDMRKQIYNTLGYTTSGGLGRNKNLAKLAGGFLKPDNQTIVLNDQVSNFLQKFELLDINGMGGKSGELVLSKFAVPGNMNSLQYLLKFSQQELNEQYPNLYQIVRGDYIQPLRDRVDIKSMMSRKQLMNNYPIKTVFDCLDWIKTFVGDLCNRLNDLDEEKGVLTRPKTVSVNLHLNRLSPSRQCPVSVFKDLKRLENTLIDLSLKLLIELIEDSYDLTKLNNGKPDFHNVNKNNKINIPPISNFAVIVSNLIRLDNSLDLYTADKKVENSAQLFKDFEMQQRVESSMRETKNRQKEDKLSKSYIDNLFAKFEEEKKVENDKKLKSKSPEAIESPSKSRKLDKAFINGLFQKYNELETQQQASIQTDSASKSQPPPKKKQKPNIVEFLKNRSSTSPKTTLDTNDKGITEMEPESEHYCKECNQEIIDKTEHDDFHLALKLSKEIQ